MEREQVEAEAIQNALRSQSVMNYNAIFQGFMEKGIAEEDIKPRENVFTYHAWRALDRQVKRGEHGVKVVTWVPMTKKDKESGEVAKLGRRPKSATVFHVSQTEPIAK